MHGWGQVGPLCGSGLEEAYGLFQLAHDVDAKVTALQADAALDALGGLVRVPLVPALQFVGDAIVRTVDQPDQPADLELLGTGEAVMGVLYTSNTSLTFSAPCWSCPATLGQ